MYNQQQQQNNNSMYRIPNRIFVGGIPQSASQDELRDYFSHFGHVKDARIITDTRGNSKGYGFITYDSENDASKVLSLKEEDLIFKENKLNIGHAFRKKNFVNNYQNNGMGNMQGGNMQGGGLGQHGNNMGQQGGMGQQGMQHGNIGGGGGNMNGSLAGMAGLGGQQGHPQNNYLDASMGNMHPMGGLNGMNGAGMHHPAMNPLAGMNGMSGINGIGSMGNMPGMGGIGGMGGINMN